MSDKTLKSRGWPWVQMGIRGVLGNSDKLEKANFLSDGSLLVKTKNETQTDKLLKTQQLAGETCEVKFEAPGLRHIAEHRKQITPCSSSL